MSGHSACMPCIKAVIAQSDRHIATAFCSLTVIPSNQSCTVRCHVHSYHPQLRTSGSASYPRATCTTHKHQHSIAPMHTSNSSSYISSTTSYATPAILCLRLHYTHISICTHPAAHRDVEAPAAQAISIPANSMPSCSTYISTAIIHAIFAIPCPPQHHTQAMQPDLKSVCACRKAANSSHRSCSPTCTASGIR